MATRYYPGNGNFSFNPTTRGSWTTDNTNPFFGTVIDLQTTHFSSSSTGSFTTKTTTGAESFCEWKMISPAIGAQTITGTVDLVFSCYEQAASVDAFLRVHIWVSAGSTSTLRGTLLNQFIGSTEFSALGLTGVQLGAQSLSSVSTSNGDRIIVELGWYSASTDTSNAVKLNNYGTTTTDLTSGSTSTSNPPWIEFSQTIVGQTTTRTKDVTADATLRLSGSRFYATSTTASVDPGNQGAWSVTAATPAYTLARAVAGTSAVTKSATKNAAATQTGLCLRLITPPLAAQTITGNLDLCFRMSEGSASNDMVLRCHAWVSQGDTSTLRGTLINSVVDSVEFLTTLTGRSPLSMYSLSTVGAQDGDRIVIELGWSSPTSVSSQSGSIATGGTATTTPLTPGSTSSTQYPWVEFDTPIYFSTTKEVTADAIVVDTVVNTKEITGTGLVQETKTKEITADSLVQAERTTELTTDATVLAPDSLREITADAILLDQAQHDLDVEADGLVRDTKTTELDGDAYVVATASVEVDADGFIIVVPWVEITADGYIPAVPDQTKEITADGYAVAGVARTAEVQADAIVAPGYEIFADAIVTTEIGSGSLVAWGSTPFSTPNQFRIALAEKYDGNILMNASEAQGFTWVAGFSADVTALGVAVDISQFPSAPLTLSLSLEDGTVLATAELSETLWYDFYTNYEQASWFLVELDTPVSVTAGTAYIVTATGTDWKLLVTRNSNTVYGMTGNGINCLVVSDEAPSSYDGRTVWVLPTITDGVLGTRTVTVPAGQAVIDTLIIGAQGEVVLASSQNVTMTIRSLLYVSGAGVLRSEPVNKSHGISFLAGGIFRLHGSFLATGAAKTRAAHLTSERIFTQTNIAVDETTGWLSGDRLYLESDDDGDGAIVVVDTIIGSTVNLATGVGATVATGGLVLNLTRSVRVSGLAPDNRATLDLGLNAILNLSHVELRALSPLQPAAGADITLLDVVFSDRRVKSINTGGTALDLSAFGSYTDITVVRAKIGIVTRTFATFAGTTYLAAISDGDAGVKVQSLSTEASIEAANIAGAVVAVSGGAKFSGSLTTRLRGSNRSGFTVPTGIASGLVLSDCDITGSGTDDAVLYLPSGSGLGSLQVDGITTNLPYLRMAPGAYMLGDGQIKNAVTTATNMFSATRGKLFIRLIDEDGTSQIGGFSQATLMLGSLITNATTSRTASGWSGQSTATVHGGTSSLFLRRDGQEGTHQLELGRIGVNGGESVTIQAWAYGDLTLSLESAIAPDATVSHSGASWGLITVSTVADSNGVIVLNASTTSVSNVYLDEITRV